MINIQYVKDSFSHKKVVRYYTAAVHKIGLWRSEKYLIKKYSSGNKNIRILDRDAVQDGQRSGCMNSGFIISLVWIIVML